MLVDDSAVIRGLLKRILDGEEGIVVEASAGNGKRAIEALDRFDVEVVILDIEMPEMDGMTALPLLLEKKPGLRVIMASTLTAKNAAISLKAIANGASEYIPKPSSTGALATGGDFQHELVTKIRALGQAARREARAPALRRPGIKPAAAAPKGLYGDAKVALRKGLAEVPKVLAIGSSTGGPQALFNMFELLGNRLTAPILITQHMPPTFTTILAQRLQKVSGLQASEAVDGEIIVGNRIYVAPGDFHMIARRGGGAPVIKIDSGPPENYCRPAVDPMLRSLAAVYGGKLMVVILTGMGTDGTKGAREVVAAHGSVIAQDEPTSVVWGMPGSVATNGLCSAVLPLSGIAPYVLRKFGAPTA
jgi:two-component system chemotaxis response regulator CheB